MARNILVVEDDNNISNLIKMYLDKEGFEVRLAADGGKAFADEKPGRVKLAEVFLRVALGGEKPADVAADYGLTRNAVDQIRPRVATRLRALAETLASAGD